VDVALHRGDPRVAEAALQGRCVLAGLHPEGGDGASQLVDPRRGGQTGPPAASGLRRTLLPRTPVNKAKEKGRSYSPRPQKTG
jgi:hypothetical protein